MLNAHALFGMNKLGPRDHFLFLFSYNYFFKIFCVLGNLDVFIWIWGTVYGDFGDSKQCEMTTKINLENCRERMRREREQMEEVNAVFSFSPSS